MAIQFNIGQYSYQLTTVFYNTIITFYFSYSQTTFSNIDVSTLFQSIGINLTLYLQVYWCWNKNYRIPMDNPNIKNNKDVKL